MGMIKPPDSSGPGQAGGAQGGGDQGNQAANINFFPSMPFTPEQYREFMKTEFKFMSQIVKHNMQRMKKAMQKMKQRES